MEDQVTLETPYATILLVAKKLGITGIRKKDALVEEINKIQSTKPGYVAHKPSAPVKVKTPKKVVAKNKSPVNQVEDEDLKSLESSEEDDVPDVDTSILNRYRNLVQNRRFVVKNLAAYYNKEESSVEEDEENSVDEEESE